MKNIEEVVMKIHTEIMHQKGIEKKSTLDMEIRPQNGITSESIVIFILNLEDELNIELDDFLPQIRKVKTIRGLADIVNKAYSNHNV